MELKATVYGVEFVPVGKIVYYLDNGEDIKPGDLVLVVGEFGLEAARVVLGPKEVSMEEVGYELKAIIRKLVDEDMEIYKRNLEDATKARYTFRQMVKRHGLPMKLVHVKYTFDRTRLIFFFSSETRVDFRDLVKDLAKEFRTRIELRQVGARDELKMMGGLGLCGRPTCCSVFLREFKSVKLELARKQQMMINPAKISGTCRRLLCCLTYENDFYEEELKDIPDEGSTIEYEGKTCKVINVNVFLQEVTVLSQDREMLKIPFDYFKRKLVGTGTDDV